MLNIWRLTIFLTAKHQNFLWVCWFLCKSLLIFTSLNWKFKKWIYHNPSTAGILTLIWNAKSHMISILLKYVICKKRPNLCIEFEIHFTLFPFTPNGCHWKCRLGINQKISKMSCMIFVYFEEILLSKAKKLTYFLMKKKW